MNGQTQINIMVRSSVSMISLDSDMSTCVIASCGRPPSRLDLTSDDEAAAGDVGAVVHISSKRVASERRVCPRRDRVQCYSHCICVLFYRYEVRRHLLTNSAEG